MLDALKTALSKMSMQAQLLFPAALKQALLDQAAELDRLRAEVNELRSKMDNGE